MPSPTTAGADDVDVWIVCDAGDAARAAQLAEALEALLGSPVRIITERNEVEDIQDHVALFVVSAETSVLEEMLESRVDERRRKRDKPRRDVPIVVDESMRDTQDDWQGATGLYLGNEPYFDYCDPDSADLARLVSQIQAKAKSTLPRSKGDVFIAHDLSSHDLATTVARALERDHDLSVRLPTKSAMADTKSLVANIQVSTTVIVLATKAYMHTVNIRRRFPNPSRDAFLEICKRRYSRTIVAALEVGMIDSELAWRASFGFGLLHLTPIDATSLTKDAMARLANEVKERIQAPLRSVEAPLSPYIQDIYFLFTPSDDRAWVKDKAAAFTYGTRAWVLNSIATWFEDVQSPLFLLSGGPATGKSVLLAILCTCGLEDALPQLVRVRRSLLRKSMSRIRSLWRRNGEVPRTGLTVAAFHFFRRNDEIASSAKQALVNIIWQLCESVDNFAQAVREVLLHHFYLDVDSDNGESKELFDKLTLSELYRHFLARPARDIQYDEETRLVIVIDAIDECDDGSAFVKHVLGPWSRNPDSWWLPFLVSTRKESEVQVDLQHFIFNEALEHKTLDPLNPLDPDNLFDMQCHVASLLRDMENVVDPEHLNACTNVLAESSQGSFLWAGFLSCVLRNAQVASSKCMLTLSDVQDHDLIPRGLNAMRSKAFYQLQASLNDEKSDRYTALLAPLAAAREPLHIEFIQALLGLEDHAETEKTLDQASGIIVQNARGRYSLVHPSVARWLTNKDESGDQSVDCELGHESLAALCLANAEDDYSLRHVLFHLIACGQFDQTVSLLNDFSWVQQAIDQGKTLEERYKHITALVQFCKEAALYEIAGTQTPQLLHKAVRELARDPRQLAPQILARFDPHRDQNDPLYTSMQAPPGKWLRPIRQSLPHPGYRPRDRLVSKILPYEDLDAFKWVTIEGSRVICLQGNGWAHLWDMTSREHLHSWIFPVACSLKANEWANSVDISGSRAVFAVGRTVYIVNVETGQVLREINAKNINVFALLEGSRLVICEHWLRRRVPLFEPQVWDVDTGEKMHVLSGHTRPIEGIAISVSRVATASSDETARVWDLETGTQLHELRHSTSVTTVAASPTSIATGAEDSVVRIWDAENGELVRELECRSGFPEFVLFTSKWIICFLHVQLKGNLLVWDAATCQQHLEMPLSDSYIHSLAVLDDVLLACAVTNRDNDTKVEASILEWNLADLSSCKEPARSQGESTPHTFGARAVTTSIVGDLEGKRSGFIYVWDLKTGDLVNAIDLNLGNTHSKIYGYTFLGNSYVAFAVGKSNWDVSSLLGIWDILTGEQLRTPQIGKGGKIEHIDFAGDTLRIARSVGQDGGLHDELYSLHSDSAASAGRGGIADRSSPVEANGQVR
ncbi:F-box/WD repeat-containing protein 7 [Hondaea fermentalgiana]|uniref:F-box/WD repeat-containing protein 7 n=1 Tax=Hondaea fermentalgiana TaxID=2315210 RepID=A0A2R5GQC6_9STRA|nr:F-box/WD repeat-containing protein 7 [Hondaea fermentalgiana]|eukprot:GBG31978.1 F-box/WD repeat-containing protein 7 [Hondaea fermentalgiana]